MTPAPLSDAAVEFLAAKAALGRLCNQRMGDTAAAEAVRQRLRVAWDVMSKTERAAEKRSELQVT